MVIPVSLEKDSYNIYIEAGALQRVGELLDLDRRVLVVTDTGVPSGYAAAVAAACRQAEVCTLPVGESSKNFESYQQLLRAMLRLGMRRGDCVAAVGGGMVGDLAGFAAATYMRGVDFYNIPTTLLAQVDSSIGGKTAIDMDGVKNIVGAFHQPRAVLIDPDTLRSLTIKKRVVEQDPLEKGLRRVLNFGHTVGHAIESSYHGQLLHGECVALGMLPMCTPAVRAQLLPILQKYGLPTAVATSREALLPYLRHDKKGETGGTITAVLVEEAGTFRFAAMTPEEILNQLEGVLL